MHNKESAHVQKCMNVELVLLPAARIPIHTGKAAMKRANLYATAIVTVIFIIFVAAVIDVNAR